MAETSAPAAGVRVEVHGTVQGVGFRPYVYRLATAHGLHGDVLNAGGDVVIRARGTPAQLESFLRRLPAEVPPAARITGLTASPIPAAAVARRGFRVRESTSGAASGAREVSPDLATCPACLRELFDPADRRYRYPFLNCTDCGPRATIVDDLPYDRERTAMAGFALCERCAAEYADPADRRFHAEPVACPRCGPRLWWLPSTGPDTATGAPEPPAAEPPAAEPPAAPEPTREGNRPDAAGLTGEGALARAVAAIAAGGLVAVKGVGGYQLVCDAGDDAAVARLRAAKRRPTKPLAVMVADLTAAHALAELSTVERTELVSAARPIVLVRRRPGAPGLADGVCAGLPEVGLFMPYSPLHHLLLDALRGPLVVTSGNRRGEPIAVDDAVALDTLGPLVDGVLGHDRPIRSRYDDSVLRVRAGAPSVIRRARGYAPAALALPVPAPQPVLAVGAQLKNTVTVAVAGSAVLGPHTGDLADVASHDAFTATVDRLCRWQSVHPVVIAHDAHPGYLSTRYALDRCRPQATGPAYRAIAVQHHHAHIAAVAAEHGLAAPFLGVAYDGLGMGDDGTLWGGELLLATYTGYRRLARFARAPLPGGEAAVRRPARMALAYLYAGEALGSPRPDPDLAAGLLARLDPREVAVVRRMLERGVNSPVASSAGRLFDAVASLLGLCDEASYEGEGAVALEAAASGYGPTPALPWRLARRDGLAVYDHAPTLHAVLRAGDRPAGLVAAAFHQALAEVTCALVAEAARETGVATVCLGGGVFVNRRLTTAVLDGLTAAGLAAYTGQRVPVNDGGISYGQAAVAAARLAAAARGDGDGGIDDLRRR